MEAEFCKIRVSMPRAFPEEVLEHVLSFIDSHCDRNAVSLVCKLWYDIERWSRRKIFIGNCYAVSPPIVIRRFTDLRSVSLKGKPHFADYNLVPDGWGGHALPWIAAFADAYPSLEELRLKRMVVTDEALELVAKRFKNFKVLMLSSCEGFSSDGLAAIASNCRHLKKLEFPESKVDDISGNWLSQFPDSYTSLESLDISCLSSEVKISALEHLVGRCPNLKSLCLNRAIPLDKLPNLLHKTPQLVDLGTGSYTTAHVHPEVYTKLADAFAVCKGLRSLSWLLDANNPYYLPAVYSVCSGLTSLNLSYAAIESLDLIKLLSHCLNLKRLWVLDYIEDSGLYAIAESCKHLEELRVFPSDPFGLEPNVSLTEEGLVSVSAGCPKLQSVLYFCRKMTNNALRAIAENRPNLTRFRLCIIEPQAPDYLTREPFDVGFGAIVKHCKDLKRLSLSGLLTNHLFKDIGAHAKKLEMLSLAFAGDNDVALHHVLSGCKSLRKLEIRDCPFGDKALLCNAAKLEAMRSLWMSSCKVSYGACKLLGQKMSGLNVEVIDEEEPPDSRPDAYPVDKLYIYRTVAGPRVDTPGFVWIVEKK